MIAGHFGLAAGAKSSEPRAPLWALMLATIWLDVLFVPLFLSGAETIEPVPGTSGGYGNSIIHANYTHSLVGAALLAVLFGAVATGSWGRRVGVVLGAVVFSHWVLDLIVHREDLPILPGDAGNLPLLGFGLWQVPAAAIAVELVLVLAGAYLYWRAAERATSDPNGAGRARLLAALIALAGVATLAVDVLIG
jgi:membrane-bound metal-dependent hydrolase YbcI (DUF457 family)